MTRRTLFASALGVSSAVLSACSSSSPSSASARSVPEGSTSVAAKPVPPGALAPNERLQRAKVIQSLSGEKPSEWGLGLPGEVTHLTQKGKAVALTFDACGGPGGSGYDETLITLLRKHSVKATLTFNQRWITANPTIAVELANDPLFHIANHGLRHCPLSANGRSAYGIKGTKNLTEMYDEILGCRDWLQAHQPNTPILFRSGTAFSDDIGVRMCKAMGMPFLGFSVNGDAGATFTKNQIVTALSGVKSGDIVISHMNQPQHDTAKGYSEALPRLIDQGFVFAHIA